MTCQLFFQLDHYSRNIFLFFFQCRLNNISLDNFMRAWFTNNFVTFRTRVQFNLWFTVFKRPRLAELQQLIILFFTFLAKFQGNVWMINVLYLQFWHINCYLLCKNQQFSISNVRGFLQTIIFYYFCWIWCRIFFSYFFMMKEKKNF